MRWLLTILGSLMAMVSTFAMGEPLYIVNGEVSQNVKDIPSGIIKSIDIIKGEEAIEKYGLKGSNGVVSITLLYDTPPVFADDLTFQEYLEQNITWKDNDPTARVTLKYTLKADGSTELIEVMDSTDARLKRRVLKAFESAPKWKNAAMNMGQTVETSSVICIHLPLGRTMPGEYYIR